MQQFYGERPRETIRGYVAILDGNVVGIIGVAQELRASRFFSEFKPELEPYLRSMTILRTIKRVMAVVEQHKGIVYAIARQDEGRRLLTRLGFTDNEDYFVWEC